MPECDGTFHDASAVESDIFLVAGRNYWKEMKYMKEANV
jgi:hypothetical protein